MTPFSNIITATTVIINGIEITSKEDWDKTIHSLKELMRELESAKSDIEMLVKSRDEYIRENEQLRQMIFDATKPQIFGTSSVIGIPETAYNAMRDYRKEHSSKT